MSLGNPKPFDIVHGETPRVPFGEVSYQQIPHTGPWEKKHVSSTPRCHQGAEMSFLLLAWLLLLRIPAAQVLGLDVKYRGGYSCGGVNMGESRLD